MRNQLPVAKSFSPTDLNLLLKKRFEAKTNALVDSMRASSPTRSHCSLLPSALSMFDQIIAASEGKQIAMFLDYDGTLSPIVEDPDQAFMSEEMRAAVRDVARYFPTAIVTGRCRDKVYRFVKLPGLYYAGSHGMDITGPSKSCRFKKGVLFQPASEFLPMIDEVHKTLVEKTKSIGGAKVENNRFCVSVHFRCVDEKSWAALAEQVRSVLNKYPKLSLTQGKKVLEIRPSIKWDKGRALEFLLEALGLHDRGQGFGILVSKVPKETNASYSLQEPSEAISVEQFLRRLVDWKKYSRVAAAP
ncbi:putative trehalose-phosphate phosphatase D [Hibiscus syriacus]|uniref:Trehalose 6-phosphate phosphatase n=1 Tax=Hibiscus syriacus TaxID=106335 RepID=A0A6A3AIK3_HIBSY|nr:putative trehalose-phosphate phosphatase D [Hibiscus syriacus]